MTIPKLACITGRKMKANGAKIPNMGIIVPILGMAMLAGCAGHVVPKVIQIPQAIYVPIPPDLSADCPMPAPAKTVGDAIRYAIEAKGDLIACNDRMAAIRAVQGSPQK
jgi:hypothetical protein